MAHGFAAPNLADHQLRLLVIFQPFFDSMKCPRDPKNFLEGPLSVNASTRLRQMLARPGIVVSAPPRRYHTLCLTIFSFVFCFLRHLVRR